MPLAFQIIGGILALYGLWQLILYPIRKIWPTRDTWIVEFRHNGNKIRTPDLRTTLSKDKRAEWVSPNPQSIGDTYIIDLGKYRLIDGIEFYERIPSSEFPKKWTLSLMGEWENLVASPPIHGEGRIIQEFPPVKLQIIEIMIGEPNTMDDGTPYHWRIQNIYLREIKFKVFNHLIRRKI